ncbi:unnamed protein product [Macrosiphum euphorbiae]|uniref:C2H2-type domain-containing protein n=1 Tax=Macrosiphum euphorbiae TaxID=13131 RepID=A0AAV0W045_9HEMI|nr:unnamed protein product [Macrosiphum euphorbiae]
MVHSSIIEIEPKRSQSMLFDIESEKNTSNCRLCKLPLDLCKHQKSHKKNHEKLYKPMNSQSTFSEGLHLTKHTKTPEQKKTFDCKPFECSLCRSTFPTLSELESHSTSHIYNDSFQCHLCDASFISKSLLDTHMLSHAGNRTFQCHHCLATYVQRKSYIYHLKTHKDHEMYKCVDFVRLTFFQKSAFMSHMKMHPKNNPYKCSVCGISYLQKTDMIKHEKTHMIEKALLICKVCNQSFPSKIKRINHERKFHTEAAYYCIICYKLFFEKKEISLHIKLHMKNMPSKCLGCKEPLLQVPVSAKVLREIILNKKNICDVCSVIF